MPDLEAAIEDANTLAGIDYFRPGDASQFDFLTESPRDPEGDRDSQRETQTMIVFGAMLHTMRKVDRGPAADLAPFYQASTIKDQATASCIWQDISTKASGIRVSYEDLSRKNL